MRVLRLAWLGIATDEPEAMSDFLRDQLGLRVEFEQPQTVELSTAEDDRVQVFAAGHRYFDLFRGNAGGLVALFEVDDVVAARQELELADIELVGELESDAAWEWFNFRAPDGNLYALAARR
jgi:catechol 2,3-dioxygenase-like lactoylglutathione lyase family enzyme